MSDRDKVIERLLQTAALKAKLSHATQQTQACINTLVKYSEALGRLLQCSSTVVSEFDSVVEKHGACPDAGLASQVAELKKLVFELLPKETDDGEAAGEAEQSGDPDGGVDAPPDGQEPERTTPSGGAPADGEAPPEADAALPKEG